MQKQKSSRFEYEKKICIFKIGKAQSVFQSGFWYDPGNTKIRSQSGFRHQGGILF